MKYNFIKSVAIVAVLSASLTSCINDDDYGVPNLECTEPALTANKPVAEVLASATTVAREYTQEDVIEGYVTSSDERGNFFKVVYVQTKPADGTAPIGFSLAIDKTTLFGDNFYPGRKVYVSLKGLYYAKVNDALSIGALYEGNVGRINESQFKNFILPSCSEISEEELVRKLTLAEAVTNANLNTLIELQGVQFTDAEVGEPYFDEDSDNTAGGATNRYLMGGTGSTLAFRTSSFANFSGNPIPGGSGTVRGILTKYAGEYQFTARDENDITLEGTRLDVAPPIIGTAITYGLYNETFESYTTTNNQVFPNAVNDAAVGSRYWQVKTFGGNKYIQMSSFGGTPEANRSLFIIPVDFTAASTFNFQSKDGYNDGNVLKVYYSTNYTPGGDITAATLTDITSSFTIASGSTSGYATNFTNSGNYNIPASLTGNGYFIFEYTGNGNGGPTTTMQLENIRVQ